jgi:hypothetical protein
MGYTKRRVVVRQLRADRVATTLATGTDRDDRSSNWSVLRWDSDDATRATHGITSPAQVVYANDLDLPPQFDWNKHSPRIVNSPVSIDWMSEEFVGDPKRAMAVYDRAALTRASSGGKPRAAQVEFWFKRPPKEALLMLLVNDPPPPKPEWW